MRRIIFLIFLFPFLVEAQPVGSRPLNSSIDSVSAVQSGSWTNACTQSGTWVLGANSGVDIGDVTINNASGASAVNIQDGGNSITVDGSVTCSLSEPISVDDNGASLTVDGVVTCDAGTDLNTSLLALEAGGNIESLNTSFNLVIGTDGSTLSTRGVRMMGQDGTNNQTISTDSTGRINVVVASSALPTGAATATLQTSGNASLTTIATAVGVIDNTIIVDDAAFTQASTSVNMCGFLFDDTTPDAVNENDGGAARMSSNRNQYFQIRDGASSAERGAAVNASNQLTVSVDNTPVIDIIDEEILHVINTDDTKLCSEETQLNIDANISSIAGAVKLDDFAFTPGGNNVLMSGFEFDDTTPDSVNEGDGGAARMSANRNIYMQIRDAAGNERGANVDSSNRLLTGTEGNTAEGGAQGNPITAAFKDVFTGLKSVPVVFENGGIDFLLSTPVDIGLNFPDYSATGEGASWVAATANTIATARYMTVDSSGNLQIIGSIAHDAADSGNPIKTGFKARTSHQTAVANNDRSDQVGNTLGFAGVTLAHNTRSDTFTGTGNGTTIGDGFQTYKYFSIQVKGTGAGATAWTANLQCSLDNTNFTTVVSHGTADVDGTVKAFATPFPCLYFRTNVSALTLGGATNIVVTILGVQ